ncbi:MAG TPA: excinuclease ABC subunit UvrC [Nitrospirales bacterium]|jgi:excinuclease ABC subunit C|nr:excinuclease ABC subunit UvrC [Nitrospirales bacterium]
MPTDTTRVEGGIGAKLDRFPDAPGVYLMKSKGGEILYIGKANVLADRVRSYFQKGADLTPKNRLLISHVTDIETMVTRSELEALILENNLIKRHRPRFNVILRDDKNYPYLRLPIKEAFPRFTIVRKVQNDGALYYGPYVPAGALRETLRVIKKVFPLATCTIEIDGKAERPCIEYEIKRCMAPCVGYQTSKEYHEIVKQARMFLEGRDTELLESYHAQMDAAAEREDFEEAARIRDRIFKIEQTLERQRVAQTEMIDQDVVGLARNGAAADIQLLFVRGGLLVGRKDFHWGNVQDTPDEELIGSVIEQFYNKDVMPPKQVLLPIALAEADLISQWLSEKKREKVQVLTPERGKKHHLVQLAEENAAAALKDHLRDEATNRAAAEELQELFHLKKAPTRIEGFDISNIQGNQGVASMVVWEAGGAKRSEYRKFRIKTVEGADDFASMREVVLRHYSGVKEDQRPLPDLILIDGGIAQLGAAMDALRELGLSRIDIVALAKAKGEKEERVFLPGRKNPVILKPSSPATHLLQRIRDESHRFAITYHRKLRSRALLSSKLDDIAGVGPAKRRDLLRYFGSLEALTAASEADLQRVGGVGPHTAKEIRKALAAAN